MRQLSLLTGHFLPSHHAATQKLTPSHSLSPHTKNCISAVDLGRSVEVNDNIAWLLKHRLVQAMEESDRRCWFLGWLQSGIRFICDGHAGSSLGRQLHLGHCG